MCVQYPLLYIVNICSNLCKVLQQRKLLSLSQCFPNTFKNRLYFSCDIPWNRVSEHVWEMLHCLIFRKIQRHFKKLSIQKLVLETLRYQNKQRTRGRAQQKVFEIIEISSVKVLTSLLWGRKWGSKGKQRSRRVLIVRLKSLDFIMKH